MSETTFVNFPGLANVKAQFVMAQAKIEQALADMDSDIRNSTVEWEGNDKEAYEAALKRWQGYAAEMNAALGSLGLNIGDVSEIYQDTVRKSTNIWT